MVLGVNRKNVPMFPENGFTCSATNRVSKMSKITLLKVLPFHEFSTFRTVLSGFRPLLIRATRIYSVRRAKPFRNFGVGLFVGANVPLKF